MRTTNDITDFITPAYYRAWDYMRRWLFDEYWFIGGRGSGKSTVTARRIVNHIVSTPDANAACFKKHKVEIEDTVYAEILKAINRAGWRPLFKCITSPYEVTYLPTGQKIFFRGLDDAGKSKGITPEVGYLQIGWFEETDQYAGMKEIDSAVRDRLFAAIAAVPRRAMLEVTKMPDEDMQKRCSMAGKLMWKTFFRSEPSSR